jgi:purine-binding chemotaxis protein CheW
MTELLADAPEAAQRDLGGKYLTFVLAEEEYGVNILRVREIINLLDVTPIPQTSDFVQGVINLRGKVIPVLDLRRRFGMGAAEPTEHSCIIVVDVGTLVGMTVDAVREVHAIPAGAIEDPPRLDADMDNRYLLGLGKASDEIKILLDIEAVVSESAFVAKADVERSE